MTNDERDESVRRAFQELRAEDRRALPPFERMLARSSGKTVTRTAHHRAGVAWLAALAAASVLVAAGVGLIAVRDLDRPSIAIVGSMATGATGATGLVAWQSPTERLLLTTGSDLTRELPRIGAFDLEKLEAAVARTNEEGSTPLRR
jgi:hypothetical protein